MTVAHCGNEQCDDKLRQEKAKLMQEMTGMPGLGLLVLQADRKQAYACRVCGSSNGVLRCGRCKAVGYCGKEHQRADWGRHKAGCRAV